MDLSQITFTSPLVKRVTSNNATVRLKVNLTSQMDILNCQVYFKRKNAAVFKKIYNNLTFVGKSAFNDIILNDLLPKTDYLIYFISGNIKSEITLFSTTS